MNVAGVEQTVRSGFHGDLGFPGPEVRVERMIEESLAGTTPERKAASMLARAPPSGRIEVGKKDNRADVLLWVRVTPGRDTMIEGLVPGVWGLCRPTGEELPVNWDVRDTSEVQTFEAPAPIR